MNRVLLMALSLLAPTGAFAGPGQNALVVRVEKDDYGLQSQHALRYDTSQVQLTLNSNFLCGGQTEAWLGRFYRKLNSNDRVDQRELKQLSLRTGPRHVPNEIAPADAPLGSPHRIRVYLGANELSETPEYAAAATDVVKKTCTDFATWTVVHGISVRLIPSETETVRVAIIERKNGKISPRASTLETECVPEGAAYACTIPGWGRVRLKNSNGSKD